MLTLKNIKSSGPGNIPRELLKNGVEIIITIFTTIS